MNVRVLPIVEDCRTEFEDGEYRRGEEEDKQWATAVIQIQTFVPLLNSLF